MLNEQEPKLFKIHLTQDEIPVEHLKKEFNLPDCGAMVSFEGWVRNHHQGKSVLHLEYEGFEPMCLAEGARILEEARTRFGIKSASVVHRLGKLMVGECAVWVGVVSDHRHEAYEASRFIIDSLKKRLPIWKKEFYQDGSFEWVNCQHGEHEAKVPEAALYQRQVILPQVGEVGQDKLKSSSVLVIGAGALGCSALQYLVASGVGRVVICEPDVIEPSNLHRQVLYSYASLGQSKVKTAVDALKALNPFASVEGFERAFDAENGPEWMASVDLVLDCTDSFHSKSLIQTLAFEQKKPLIQASLYQFEGQLGFWNHPHHPAASVGCFHCLWPSLPQDEASGSCVSAGVLGPVAGVLGSFQALEAIKFILGLDSPVHTHLVLLNLLTYEQTLMWRGQNPSCSQCQNYSPQWLKDSLRHPPKIMASGRITQKETSQEIALSNQPLGISWADFQDRFLGTGQSSSPWVCVGVGISQADQSQILSEKAILGGGALQWWVWPHEVLDEFGGLYRLTAVEELEFPLGVLVVCGFGVRSRSVAKLLREKGVSNVYYLLGGLQTWKGLGMGDKILSEIEGRS
ncbi:MAG: ThiF family adenylyltransferase [Cyanobacteria bacterium]|nr:ThiF family adenylyltransferase [Cyanobacteriota bacterium]